MTVAHLTEMDFDRDDHPSLVPPTSMRQASELDPKASSNIPLLPPTWKNPVAAYYGGEPTTLQPMEPPVFSSHPEAAYGSVRPVRTMPYYYSNYPQQPPLPQPQAQTNTAYMAQHYHHHQQQQHQQPYDNTAVRPPRKRRRPPHSYASMIAQAILSSSEQKLTLREIYDYVQTRYPHLYEANEPGWQNTIRHNLSLNRCFRKLPRTSQHDKSKGKGGYWCVDIEELNNTSFGSQILSSGIIGSYHYWQNQQQQQQQQGITDTPRSYSDSFNSTSDKKASSSFPTKF